MKQKKTSETVEVPAIPCRDFAIWLAAQREQPSEHIKAWFDAKGVAVSSGGAGEEAITEARQRRAVALAKSRGVRREILEHWDGIALLHGTNADVAMVARYLSSKRDDADKKPVRKTISNALSKLRKDGLIP